MNTMNDKEVELFKELVEGAESADWPTLVANHQELATARLHQQQKPPLSHTEQWISNILKERK